MQCFARSMLLLSAATALSACSLIAAPDRDKIPSPDAGAGQGGGGTRGSGGTSSGGAAGAAGASGGVGGGAGNGGAAGIAGNAQAGGGAGGGAPCATAADCTPSGECWKATCKASRCGEDPVPNDTATATQTAGDCHKKVCNGAGSVVTVVDDTDVHDDQNPCTADSCNNGTIVNDPVAANTSCGSNLKCDGSGKCVGCITAADCPGQDGVCESRTCVAGACGVDFVGNGTAIANQTTGDCAIAECDGAGNVVQIAASDPNVDGNPCTQDLCSGTTPQNPPELAGTPCAVNGGVVCDGAGACVQCVVDSDCGTTTECRTYHCSSGACSFDDTASGTALTAGQTAGDCKVVVCNGTGGTRMDNDDTDVLPDTNQCTNDICSSGTPQHPPVSSGTACTDGGGVVCDGSGNCVACVDGTTCSSKVCDVSTHTCSAPTCSDNTQNGSETDVDCGGTCSTQCADGKKCATASDCVSGLCIGSFCVAPTVVTTTPSGGTTAVPVTTSIEITFNTAMDPSSLAAKVTLDSGPCNGTIQLSSDDFTTCVPFSTALAGMSSGNTIATLTPAPALDYGSSYKIRVTTGALAAVGTSLATAYTSTAFTTEPPVTGTQNESGQAGEADYCVVLTSPFSVSAGVVTGTITGAIREAGVTDSPGASSAVTAEVGYGPSNKNPESESGWTFFSAAYTQDATNTDEYAGTFTAPAAGSYGYVFRFSLDSGASWTYCDLDGAGSESGFDFQATHIPPMTVTP